MKKRKKLNNRWRNKIRGIEVGDNVFVTYTHPQIEDTDCSCIGILEEIGDKYIVVNHCIIEEFELMNIGKI